MHGIGNDYVYVNGFDEKVADAAEAARRIADRHFGVGGDGLILILPSEKADVRMSMFNADGSEAEMCGNGIRCVAKYAYDHHLTSKNPMTVETGRGVLTLALELSDGKVSQVTVDMGEPILALADIPVNPEKVQPSPYPALHRISGEDSNEHYDAAFVSMGNPHMVIYREKVHTPETRRVGPFMERHPAFPRRMNVHFVQVLSDREVTMQTWERGSGTTLACGTGACAVCVAGVLAGKTGRQLLAHLPGGDLRLQWREADNHVYMTGPAVEVFSGEWTG